MFFFNKKENSLPTNFFGGRVCFGERNLRWDFIICIHFFHGNIKIGNPKWICFCCCRFMFKENNSGLIPIVTYWNILLRAMWILNTRYSTLGVSEKYLYMLFIYTCVCLFDSISRSWKVDRGVPIPLSFRDIVLTFDHFTWWLRICELVPFMLLAIFVQFAGAFIERIMCNHRLAVTQRYSSIHQDISQRHTGGALGSFVLGNLIGLNLEFFGHELSRHPGSHRGNFGKFQVQHWNLEKKFGVWYKSTINSICCLCLSQPLCPIFAQAQYNYIFVHTSLISFFVTVLVQ